jgi:DnaJ-class molecular chaperone
MDPYHILGVPFDSDEDTIRKAYRRLAKKYHPDKNNCVNSEAFKAVKKAYDEVLSHKNVPKRRGVTVGDESKACTEHISVDSWGVSIHRNFVFDLAKGF